MNRTPRPLDSRSAFTLVELVVVILILGILAGVAAPKLLNTSATATENGLRQTLSVVRDAIELYAAQNGGALPSGTDADFKNDLKPLLRGEFPVCPVGAQDNVVTFVSGTTTTADGATGWMFNTSDGTFICNSAATDSANDAYSSY